MSKVAHDSEVPAHGQQVITACAFIHHTFDGVEKVFLPRRAATKKFLPNVYELPGGHIDFGEDIVDGLKREIHEEFGMTIWVGDPFAAFTYSNPVKGSHSIEVIYFASFNEPIENIKIDPDDHSEYGWFAEDELDQVTDENKGADDIEIMSIKKGFALLTGKKRTPVQKLDSQTLRAHKGVSFVGVGTVFFCHDGKGKFLMSKRSKNARDEQGKWEIAGGGLKWGVKAVDNLQREIKEEFGADAKNIAFLGYRDIFRELDDGTPTHWLMLDYAVEVDPAQVKRNEPDLCDELGWFTLDSQPSPVHSQHETLMKKYRTQLEEILKPGTALNDR